MLATHWGFTTFEVEVLECFLGPVKAAESRIFSDHVTDLRGLGQLSLLCVDGDWTLAFIARNWLLLSGSFTFVEPGSLHLFWLQVGSGD